MTLQELINYCQREGVSYRLIARGDVNTLRVLDMTQLPMPMREYFDEAGYYNQPLVVEPELVPELTDEPDSHEETKR